MKNNTFLVEDMFSNSTKSGYSVENNINNELVAVEFPTYFVNNNDWQGVWIGKERSDGVIIRHNGLEYCAVYKYKTNRKWWYDDMSFSILDKDKKEILEGWWPAQPTRKRSFFHYKNEEYEVGKDRFFGFAFSIYKNNIKVGSVVETSRFLSLKRNYKINLPYDIDIVTAASIFFILRNKLYKI